MTICFVKNKFYSHHLSFWKISKYSLKHVLAMSTKKNVHIVGFGKAVLGMAKELENKLREHIVSGVISIPDGMHSLINYQDKHNSRIQVYEGALNNVPDKKSQIAAAKLSDLVASLTEKDLLFVLISGGGSALLPSPKPPVTLEEKIKVIKLLTSKGASIQELNAVRKRLSVLKGGGLAELAMPAKIVSLILSDIIGDPLSLIASGPTVKNTDNPQLPLSIIEKYNLINDIPQSVLTLLQNIQETESAENKSSFLHVSNFIIGNNQMALEAAAIDAGNLNYLTSIMTDTLFGKARDIGMKLIYIVVAALEHDVKLATKLSSELSLLITSLDVLLNYISKLESGNRELCILLGGETTVEVHGTGIGGRNQELALAASIELKAKKPNRNIVLLGAGTDGIDGPNNAAGALATMFVAELAEKDGLKPIEFLNNNDSNTFYSKVSNGLFHVITGHTGTNVMDIIVILIK